MAASRRTRRTKFFLPPRESFETVPAGRVIFWPNILHLSVLSSLAIELNAIIVTYGAKSHQSWACIEEDLRNIRWEFVEGVRHGILKNLLVGVFVVPNSHELSITPPL